MIKKKVVTENLLKKKFSWEVFCYWARRQKNNIFMVRLSDIQTSFELNPSIITEKYT